jgi:fibronectin-binding autotransporter adhesin
MQKLLSIIIVLLFALPGWAATNNFTADGGEWNTAGNWSLGRVPDATDDVTVTGITSAGKSLTITTTAAVAKSIDFSGAANAFTLSGSVSITISGSLTCKTGMTWSHSGAVIINGAGTITSNSVSLASITSLRITAASVGLGDALALGTKPLYVDSAATLTSNNNTITCGQLGNNSVSGAVTLTLGSSTLNCSSIRFAFISLTVTANTATVNITRTSSGNGNMFMGAAEWGGTTTITLTDSGTEAGIWDANTFGNLTIVFNPTTGYNALNLEANQTVTGAFTITGNGSNARGGVGNIRGQIRGLNNGVIGTQRTITAGSVVLSGNLAGSAGTVDFRDVRGAGAGSWDLSAHASGDRGGNTGITFRTATTYYLAAADFTADNSRSPQDYDNVWSTTDDGTPDGAGIFPLPQDTIVINNNSFTSSGQQFAFHANGASGTINATALTEANALMFPRYAYGDILYTGSGVSIAQHAAYSLQGIDARLKNERSSTALLIDTNNLDPATYTIAVNSAGGTVKLSSAFKTGTSFTLTKGTLDLNGQTLTCGTFLSTNSNARTISDSAGGAKIILNGLTGTLFDTTTSTNLTVSNAPDIQIGDGSKTLTGDVTFMGAGKTYGDFTVKKHAGNYDAIITGTNTFGVLMMETPDATYQYSDLQLTSGTTTTVSSLVADGTASYKIGLKSVTGGSAATISDTTGANTVSNMTIQDITVSGATFTANTSTDVSGNSGWIWPSTGIPAGLLMCQ